MLLVDSSENHAPVFTPPARVMDVERADDKKEDFHQLAREEDQKDRKVYFLLSSPRSFERKEI